MTFTRRLRPGIKSGEITTTNRFWHTPRVTVGKRYAMDENQSKSTPSPPSASPASPHN